MKKYFKILLLFLFLISSATSIKAVELNEIELINVNSNFALVAEYENGKATPLLEKNADARMYPASMTKMLTVYTALSHIDDPNQIVTVEAVDLAGLVEADASVAGFTIGQQVTLKEALLGSMLPSGADASNLLARIVSGDVASFVSLMNQTAQEIGMTDSNFVNTSGLYDENHYTTLHDILKLMEVAFANDLFKEIISTLTYSSTDKTLHPQGLTLSSTLSDYSQGDKSKIGYIKGGKTGWVPESGYCLASFSEYKGKLVFVITGEAYEYGSQLLDHNSYYKFLFENQHEVELLAENESLGFVDLIYQDNPSTYEVINPTAVTQQLPLIINHDDLVIDKTFKESVVTPVSKGTEIGEVSISLNDEIIHEQVLSFDRDIERNDYLYYTHQLQEYLASPQFYTLIQIVGVILVLLILIGFILTRRHKRRIKREGRKGFKL